MSQADQLTANLRTIAGRYESDYQPGGVASGPVWNMLGVCALLSVECPEVWGVVAARFAAEGAENTAALERDPEVETRQLIHDLLDTEIP